MQRLAAVRIIMVLIPFNLFGGVDLISVMPTKDILVTCHDTVCEFQMGSRDSAVQHMVMNRTPSGTPEFPVRSAFESLETPGCPENFTNQPPDIHFRIKELFNFLTVSRLSGHLRFDSFDVLQDDILDLQSSWSVGEQNHIKHCLPQEADRSELEVSSLTQSQPQVKTPGTKLAATPISIPRPVGLEKFLEFTALESQGTSKSQPLETAQNRIEACDLESVQSDHMLLKMTYHVEGPLTGPVYAGAFLYDSDQKAIDVGYQPMSLQTLPNGTIGVTLTLPKSPFRSQYVMTFLIHSGKVFVNARFKLPFHWDGISGNLSNGDKIMVNKDKIDSVLQSKAQFCDCYAKEAVSQYEFAIKNNLKGIVPPVWNPDANSHYQWCLTVPQEQAIQGSQLRKDYLNKNMPPETPGLAQVLSFNFAAISGDKPAKLGQKIIKPVLTKGLDPGLGP